jgi:hypothetical protein
VLYESASFLEAAEFAGEYVQDEKPGVLEIEKVDGPVRETVWTYSEARAHAKAASRQNLVRTFGFDPVRWVRRAARSRVAASAARAAKPASSGGG